MGAGELVVGLSPFLGEVWPGDMGAGEAARHADRGGGGVKSFEGLGVEVIGYCGAPVHYCAEDLVSCQILERGTKEEVETNGEGDLHRRTALSVGVSARLYSYRWLACPSQIDAVVEYIL